MTQSPIPPPQPLLPTRPEQGRALLTVLIVMAFLAALALLFSRGADRLSDRWTAQLTESATVQVLIASEEARQDQLQMTLEILRGAAPDAELRVLSRAESLDLLKPWLGDGRLPEDLPVPGVIEIKTPTQLPAESLERQFNEAGLRTVIDDHSRFSGSLKRTVGRLVLLGISLLALIGVAAIAVTVFATRSGLAAQRDIIHVLVQAGASDGFIARLFVGQAARRGLVGGGIGVVLGACLWILVSMGPAQGSVGWRGIADGAIDGLILAGMAGLFGLICAVAAGWAAIRQLAYERRRA